VKVAAVQHDICWEAPAETARHVTPLIAAAVAAGARLVVLTEMFATGFSMASDRIAQAPDGPSTTFLAKQAAAHGVWVVASVPTLDPQLPRPVNRLVVAGPGGERHQYDKIHPFSFAGEHERYTAGTERCTVTIEGLRVSPFVCYDLRFADEFWALAHDTDVYVVPANWPTPRHEHWRALLRARAIENQAYVVGVNRVGAVRELGHSGGSAIIDPLGTVLAGDDPADESREAVYCADIDPATVRDVRAKFPFLADRRG